MTAPGSFTVGYVLTAGDMNEFGAWTTFTPTVGGIGTSAKTGKYYKFNKIGFVYIGLTFSGAATGTVTVDWPLGFTPADTATDDPRSMAVLYDSSAAAAAQYYPLTIRNTATNWRFGYHNVTGANVNLVDLSNTSTPVTLASGDKLNAFWVGEIS